MRDHYRASWGKKLIVTTALFLVVCLVALYLVQGWVRLAVLAIILISAVFAIRGYSVHQGKLLIHRLGWSTKYDLSKLSSAEVSPGATIGSIRTLGIGGLFGFVGNYRNDILGSYKAFVTDETNTVVLDFSGEKIVVTPDAPEEFVQAVCSGGVGQVTEEGTTRE